MKLTNNSHDDKYWNFKCSEAGILKRTNAINIYLNAKSYVFFQCRTLQKIKVRL